AEGAFLPVAEHFPGFPTIRPPDWLAAEYDPARGVTGLTAVGEAESVDPAGVPLLHTYRLRWERPGRGDAVPGPWRLAQIWIDGRDATPADDPEPQPAARTAPSTQPP